MDADQVRETLRQWISIDDQSRGLQAQIKQLKEQKNQVGGQVMEFMRSNQLDNFVIEGGAGTISRQQKTRHIKPPKHVIRAQLAVLLADQPARMTEVLRVMEGMQPNGQEDEASVVTTELLTRRLPRTQHVNLG